MPSWAKWALSLLIAAGLIWIGWRVMPVLVTLHILVCFVLVAVIMLQSGNAADLAGAFGGAGSQTAFGPRGAATFLSRATTWCAIVFMATSLALSFKRATPGTSTTNSILEQTQKSGAAPAKPTPAPTQSAPAQAPAPVPSQSAPAQSAPAPTPTPAPQQSAPAPTQQAPAPASTQPSPAQQPPAKP
jgi:preprotein translocase subunit SecG